jgi:hypothetical protein
MLPTIADCRRVMVSELERIFDYSPNLEGKLPAPKLGDRTGKHRSTILHHLFDGGQLLYVAAHALLDKIDGMQITEEGNPVDLAIVSRRQSVPLNRLCAAF